MNNNKIFFIICCIFIFLQAHNIYTYKKKLSVHKLNKVIVNAKFAAPNRA